MLLLLNKLNGSVVLPSDCQFLLRREGSNYLRWSFTIITNVTKKMTLKVGQVFKNIDASDSPFVKMKVYLVFLLD